MLANVELDVATFVPSRLALHAVAEWVLAPLRFAHDGHIGLRPTDGGFGHDLARVDGAELVIGDRRTRLTTLRAAAAFAGLEPGRHSGSYEPVTPWNAEAPLAVDADAARSLAAWFAAMNALLDAVRDELPAGSDPTATTLWPEHFDLALAAGPPSRRVNLGASAGDAEHPLPYLYVGPWDPASATGDAYWNESWGSSLSYRDALDADAARTFVERGFGLVW
jgi:hypothetical protein